MSRTKPRVLVVDDEPFVRKIAERVLQRSEIEVISASNGTEALEALAGSDDIALILLDASLPDMNAERVLEVMRDRGDQRPVLLSSGFGQESLPTEGEFENVRGFLPKPYSVAKLTERIRELLPADI